MLRGASLEHDAAGIRNMRKRGKCAAQGRYTLWAQIRGFCAHARNSTRYVRVDSYGGELQAWAASDISGMIPTNDPRWIKNMFHACSESNCSTTAMHVFKAGSGVHALRRRSGDGRRDGALVVRGWEQGAHLVMSRKNGPSYAEGARARQRSLLPARRAHRIIGHCLKDQPAVRRIVGDDIAGVTKTVVGNTGPGIDLIEQNHFQPTRDATDVVPEAVRRPPRTQTNGRPARFHADGERWPSNHGLHEGSPPPTAHAPTRSLVASSGC